MPCKEIIALYIATVEIPLLHWAHRNIAPDLCVTLRAQERRERIESMDYGKKLMRATELYKLGVPRPVILQAVKENKPFVRKANPLKVNSPLIVDTEEFDKWWVRQNMTFRRVRA